MPCSGGTAQTSCEESSEIPIKFFFGGAGNHLCYQYPTREDCTAANDELFARAHRCDAIFAVSAERLFTMMRDELSGIGRVQIFACRDNSRCIQRSLIWLLPRYTLGATLFHYWRFDRWVRTA